jgi:hypothetical protein
LNQAETALELAETEDLLTRLVASDTERKATELATGIEEVTP